MQNNYRGTNIGSRKQKALLKASMNNPPNTSLKDLAEEADVSMQTVSKWFANSDFEHWWIMSHYEGARGLYVEKVIRAVCERAIQPQANARDRELALQILAPERLNKAKRLPTAPQIVVNFVGTEKRLDMPYVEGKLPVEPKLLAQKEETAKDEPIEAEIVEPEAEVA